MNKAHLSLATKGEGVNVTRLSDIHSNAKWRDIENTFGVKPEIDFAYSEPFQLLTEASAQKIKEAGEAELDGPHLCRTVRTSLCIRGSERMEKMIEEIAPELEVLVSRLVGNGHRMRIVTKTEHAHLNVQKGKQARPVDNWHQDNTPFVLVTVLTNHVKDDRGNLIVRPDSTRDKITKKCKLAKPGMSVLLQGSHIWHQAQQSDLKERMTLVTSFHCDDPLIFDNFCIHANLQYGSAPDREFFEFLEHSFVRFCKNAEKKPEMSLCEAMKCNKVIKREVEKVVHCYQKGWDLIPVRLKTPALSERWLAFGEPIKALQYALGGYIDEGNVHNQVGNTAMKLLVPLLHSVHHKKKKKEFHKRPGTAVNQVKRLKKIRLL